MAFARVGLRVILRLSHAERLLRDFHRSRKEQIVLSGLATSPCNHCIHLVNQGFKHGADEVREMWQHVSQRQLWVAIALARHRAHLGFSPFPQGVHHAHVSFHILVGEHHQVRFAVKNFTLLAFQQIVKPPVYLVSEALLRLHCAAALAELTIARGTSLW